MNWKLYKKDDPNTYPEIDCWVLACKTFGDEFYLARCKWDNQNRCFVGDGAGAWSECYYVYIGYIPSGYKTVKVTKCTREHRCEFDYDGYCEYDGCCEFVKEMNEYCLFDNKRVWKEF